MIENPKNLVDRLQNAFLSVAADVKSLTASLAGKAKVNHTHTQGQISGLSTALSAKLDKTGKAASAKVADTANAVAWANVTGKPDTMGGVNLKRW